ncbi:hypothetical protein GCM10010435_78010 [Winogradskya consettensis]|uniref:Excalibur calcium-binding domain-containing protein n=1 Tax=Winogradskya consettensis TaxID=113560 RepID=A0A919SL80_9ACTN|nr:excalibur calcium-binding domain-containing protein [Actinoplanes consettensis]GIM74820.1 hypothetical protein Aco04nite_42220 [Actinoplanes consettensis]
MAAGAVTAVTAVLAVTALSAPPSMAVAGATATPLAMAASCTTTSAVVMIPLTSAKHGRILEHAQDAIDKGYPLTMVLNRTGAAARRKAALKGVATRPGYDRDEYPMAAGRRVNKADVRLVASSENESAGSIAGNTLRKYCDGTKYRYKGVHGKGATTPPRNDPRFATCAEAKNHGYGPYYRSSDPEYYWYQDRDADGVVCE